MLLSPSSFHLVVTTLDNVCGRDSNVVGCWLRLFRVVITLDSGRHGRDVYSRGLRLLNNVVRSRDHFL